MLFLRLLLVVASLLGPSWATRKYRLWTDVLNPLRLRRDPAYHLHKRDTDGNSTVLPPSQDPWYTAPPGLDCEPPGKLLRIRPAPGNLTSISSNCSAAYNILYRTTDSTYKPTFAVTTLFVPLEPAGALLSYQIPYDSADVDASPSYAMYAGVPLDVNQSLAKGWHVSVPDYEGPLAAFTAGVLSGHATIDSVRAVQEAAWGLGLADGAPVAMWGYSGGALASEWAAELQPQYAPELKFAGAALGGLTPNVTSVLLIINKGYAAGLAPSAIVGVTTQFPAVYQYVLSKLKKTGPYNATTFLSVKNMTLAQAANVFAFQDITAYFVDGLADLQNPIAQSITYSDGLMGYHGVPQMPIYAYKAIADMQSPIADTDALLARFCGVGVNILYERNTIGGHAADATNGHGAAVAWLNSVLGGTYNKTYPTLGCTVRNVTVNITDSPE